MIFLKRKAQISGQVFVYVLAAIMIGLLFFVAIMGINNLLPLFQTTNLESFKSDFQSKVKTVARQSYTVEKIGLDIPNEYDTICFVDAMDENGKFIFDTSKIKNSMIRNSVEQNSEGNVFLMKKNIWKDKFTADKLNVDSDYLCLENEGKLEVWLKGTGKEALLFLQNE